MKKQLKEKLFLKILIHFLTKFLYQNQSFKWLYLKDFLINKQIIYICLTIIEIKMMNLLGISMNKEVNKN
ncbi:hypothetical protein [Spiroplasma cantharicola]|uniref:Uncharacterized protein n=1 Tax=Spiroplasma cantharicola TaxID=362837 RepID=A0A0M4JJY3_9MOLU|nr:hypothetical protein [Spiroplasma cantharicola]ALD66586.1 hypothetical protein SCANT_v1c06800 [Spiroplasma cantharicola]